jgi:hypothetical protein
VNKTFEICAVLTFLTFAPLGFAQNPPATMSGNPVLTISVHDYADVPNTLLTAAEGQAKRIFQHAGLKTVWLNCGPKVENIQSKDCNMADASHLILKVLPHAVAAQVRDRSDVLGVALLDERGIGYFAYTYYDRVLKLSDNRGLGDALLGDTFAHEIGHLLLGSNSHSVSGIMCAHWNDKELRNISEGAMLFLPVQSRIMRDRLHNRKP